ncbi:MAG TPA: DUF819 family protein [Xanthomonadaceae bacterium]|nr:DUF819 family protein [Xanthomonadaceae bacterium]
MDEPASALITNDAVALGVLMAVLAFVFHTSHSENRFWKRFYSIVPGLLLCYFIPGVLNTLGVIDGHGSGLYPMARDYLLPTALVLLTLSIDFHGIVRLGPKAVIMFLTGTVGVIIGGPIALAIAGAFDPALLGDVGPESVWRGMSTQAGSWIGGGANQAAMKEVFEVGPDMFGKFVAVDVIVANIWMAVLLFLAGRAAAIDRWSGADVSAIEDLRHRIEAFQREHARLLTLPELVMILFVGFGATALSHAIGVPLAGYLADTAPVLADYSLTSPFFWIVITATTAGLVLSFTRARQLEGAGASKIGSACLYVLVATIGMHMDIKAVFSDPELFLVGLVWVAIHAALLLVVAKAIKAPVFYMAVGSQANIGGAASAPVVASAFHPSLAPVGVLLAVFGYALGTYGAWLCGLLLRWVAGG